MNQEQYFAAYKGRKIVIYPTASLPMCRFTLKSPGEIPKDPTDLLGLDRIGVTELRFIGTDSALWCYALKPGLNKVSISAIV